jgi:phosphoenolpyruvate carboxylase
VGEESLQAYVISMAKKPSDVLAVKLLMKEFGLKRCGARGKPWSERC